jgi:hypothetical protein
MMCKDCEYDGNYLEQHVEDEHLTKSKELIKCKNCNKPFAKYSYRITETNFCSRECSFKYKAKDGLDTQCSECGEDIHISPSNVKEVDGYEQKNYFCDKKCESSFKSREWVGENHPSWDGGKEKCFCEECGSEYYVNPSEVKKSKYCSRKCYNISQSIEKKEYECANCGDTFKEMPHNIKLIRLPVLNIVLESICLQ